MGRPAPPNARDLAAEIIRRTNAANSCSHVIHLHERPEARERLKLAAARILRQTVAIVPVRCATIEEWLQRYGPDRISP
jgi:hypothetical protein